MLAMLARYGSDLSDLGASYALAKVGTEARISAIMLNNRAIPGLLVSCQSAMPATAETPQSASKRVTRQRVFLVTDTAKTSSGPTPKVKTDQACGVTPSWTWAKNAISGVSPQSSQLTGLGWTI